jgi:hypothetical protein
MGRKRPSMRPRVDVGRGAAGVAAARAKADEYAASIAPIIREIRTGGTTTLGGIAKELTRRRVPTARSGTWTSTMVRRLLQRLGIAPRRRRKS